MQQKIESTGKTKQLSSEELRLKRAETLLKQKEAEYKNLEVIEKAIDIDEKRNSQKKGNAELDMDKIRLLGGLLTYCQIDEDGTTIGSEPKLKHIFSEDEQVILKNKLLNIINKL
jgi:hypothetical protein